MKGIGLAVALPLLSTIAAALPASPAKLIGIMNDPGQSSEIRKMAVKRLSEDCGEKKVRGALLTFARGPADPGLRGLAYKTLYDSTSDPEVYEGLLEALKPGHDLEVRMGAAWALLGQPRDTRAQAALLEVAKESREDPALRVEAIKSLSWVAGQDDAVRDAVISLAGSPEQPVLVRKVSILCLATARDQAVVADVLKTIMESGATPELRSKAALALEGMTLELARYFHWPHWRRQFLDPLMTL
jgi:HEAT repeat protein